MLNIVINTPTDRGIYTDIYAIDERDKYYHQLYHARCKVCGTEIKSRLIDINRKNSVCIYKYIKTFIRDYRINKIFQGMKRRCYDKHDKAYRMYGAKGITICDEWLYTPYKFEEWSLQNGYQDDLTIDRIDSSKGYSPDNCRWIDSETNSKYKKSTKVLYVNGMGLSMRDWSKVMGHANHYISKYNKKHGEKATIHLIRKYIRQHKSSSERMLMQLHPFILNEKDKYYNIDINHPSIETETTLDKITDYIKNNKVPVDENGYYNINIKVN